MPDGLTKRANEILHSLENDEAVPHGGLQRSKRHQKNESSNESGQISLVDMRINEVAEILKKTEPDTLSPIEALNLIYSLKKKIEQ